MVRQRVLLSKGVVHDVSCAHRANADDSNLSGTTAFSGYCHIFLWQKLQSCCLFLCSCFITLLSVACQVLLPRSGAFGTLDWQLAVMYLLFDTVLNTYIIGHHPPYKTCQFSCYGCYCYISLFPSPYHLIILLSQPYISFIRVCYDFCGISRLPCTQHL